MFLAAAPYFQKRFAGDEWIQENFQSSIVSVSTITNLTAMLILTNIQTSASYPFRINTALVIDVALFGLLTASTTCFLDASKPLYLAFALAMVCGSAWATGLIQNGAFAFAASFGRPEYTQAIMAGQGIAGILPPLAQMLSVLAVPSQKSSQTKAPIEGQPVPEPSSTPDEGGKSAFIYFLTAVGVSALTLIVFQPLARRHSRLVEGRAGTAGHAPTQPVERVARHFVSMKTLFHRLHWLAGSVFMCFVVTMFFPVLTGKIVSVHDSRDAGRLFESDVFIALAFFFWNLGDLLGRVATSVPGLTVWWQRRPTALFAFSIGRVLFLPLYMLCNIRGRGALVNSDVFYLVVVQFLFGLTNGWLCSSSMIAAGEWVPEHEREAAGGFMGLCLTAGLTAGSLLSFTAAGI